MIRHTIQDYLPTAEVVVKTNPYCRGMDPRHFAEWAMEHTERNLTGPGYWDCRGFVVTTFHMDGSVLDLHVKVSLNTYSIGEYLKALAE